MTSIAEIRKQYPQYEDMSDEQIARGLHTKYYSDIPFDQFSARVGLQTQQQGNGILDTMVKGVAAAGTMAGRGAANVIGTPGAIGQMISSTRPEGMSRFNPIELLGSALSYLPNPEQVRKAMFEGTGTPEYKPESSLGRLAMETGVGAVSGSLMPIGMGVGTAAKYGGMSGAGGELAGQLTEGTSAEPYARVAGAVAAPFVAPALARYAQNIGRGVVGTRPVTGDLDSKIIQSLGSEGQTPQQMQSVMANADRTGATISNRNIGLGSETVRAAQSTPEAARIARASASRDMQSSFSRIRDRVASILPATKGNVSAARSEILQTMDDTAKPLYQNFERNIGGSGFTETAPRNALNRLYRTNPDVVNHVLKNAIRADNPISGIRITANGTLDTRAATMSDLNKVIDGIDGVLYGSEDITKAFQTSTGRPNQQARVLMDIRSRINQFLRTKSPDDFAAANDIYSSGHRMRRAAQEGFDALSETRGLGESEEFFKSLNRGEQEAFRSGIASRLINNLDVAAITPNAIEKMSERLTPFMGSGNANRVRAILNNERNIQEAARRVQMVMPEATGFGSSGAVNVARLAGGVSTSPKSAIAEAAIRLADRVMTGRGPDYYNRLNVELVKATTTNNPREASRMLQGLIRRQSDAMAAARDLRRSPLMGGYIGSNQTSE